MTPELTQQFENLGVRMEHMIDRVREMPTDQQRSPVGKSFSPLQAIEHMAKTEQIYVGFIDKTNAAAVAGKKSKPNFLFGQLLKQLGKPQTSTVPSPGPFQPKEELDLDESARRWKEAKEKIHEYVAKFEDDAAAIKHPFFGWLSPYDMFLMMEKHQDYHDSRLEAH